MQSNLGDIFWQADWLYRTWAGLRIKNGTKIFELKISVIKPRNDKKKRFREKSTLIVVAGSWTGQSKALTTSLSWREIESPRPGGSLLHFVLEVQPSEGLGESPGPGCKIKFHYTAVLWLQHTQLNINTNNNWPRAPWPLKVRPTNNSEKRILFPDFGEEREIKVESVDVPVRRIIRCRNMNYSLFSLRGRAPVETQM